MKSKCKCLPGNPFHWKEINRPSVFLSANLTKNLNNSLKQTEYIEQERVRGRDISHIPGVSTKSHAQRLISVKQFVVYSKAGQAL